jgi:alkylated DNA repair protein (DNA oxidative demethylase)
MGLHRDQDEKDFAQPIVSVSLGVPATFLWGGLKRRHPIRRITLEHGHVVVWGGAARLAYLGVPPLAKASHDPTGAARYNLTLRKAG